MKEKGEEGCAHAGVQDRGGAVGSGGRRKASRMMLEPSR